MPSEDEFREAVAAHFAWTGKVCWTVVGVGCLLFAGACCTGGRLLITRTAIVWIGALVVMTGYCMWWTNRRSRSDARLICTRCGKPLQAYYDVVIATRNCAYCRRPVLAKPGSYKKQPRLDPELFGP